MSEELERLNEIAGLFKRINSKLMLIELLDNAKEAYDKYDFESGKSALTEALKLDSQNPAALRGLGCFEQYDGNFKEAINYYKQALEFSNHKEIEYTLLGTAYYLLDELDEAVENFNKAIDSNDEYTKAYEGRNQAMLENHLKIVDLQETLKKYF